MDLNVDRNNKHIEWDTIIEWYQHVIYFKLTGAANEKVHGYTSAQQGLF